MLPHRAILAAFIVTAVSASLLLSQPLVIDVSETEQQRFEGFGGIVSDAKAAQSWFGKPAVGIHFMALPIDLRAVSPSQGRRELDEWRKQYLQSELVAKAKAAGVENLVLLPDGIPDYMLANTPSPAAGGMRPLVYEFVPKYALLVADVLDQLKQEKVEFRATSLAGPSPHLTADQWTALTKYMREIATARGLSSTRLGGVGWSAGDKAGTERLAAIRSDVTAWESIDFVVAQTDDEPSLQAMRKLMQASGQGPVQKPLWLIDSPTNTRSAVHRAVTGIAEGAAVWLTTEPEAIAPLIRHLPVGSSVRTLTRGKLIGFAATRPDGSYVICLTGCDSLRTATDLAVQIPKPAAPAKELKWSAETYGPAIGNSKPVSLDGRSGALHLPLAPTEVLLIEGIP